jgi:sRNA-binding carbon storage regulator CsrA
MALSLSRTAGESIVLRTPAGETIVVKVRDIEVMSTGATTARLVIDAPREIEILRGELVDG